MLWVVQDHERKTIAGEGKQKERSSTQDYLQITGLWECQATSNSSKNDSSCKLYFSPSKCVSFYLTHVTTLIDNFCNEENWGISVGINNNISNVLSNIQWFTKTNKKNHLTCRERNSCVFALSTTFLTKYNYLRWSLKWKFIVLHLESHMLC